VAVYLLVTDPYGQKDVSAADNRLVGIVGVEVETPPDEHSSQDIAGGSDTLTRCSSNRYGKVKLP
jgi:hypothetical protein